MRANSNCFHFLLMLVYSKENYLQSGVKSIALIEKSKIRQSLLNYAISFQTTPLHQACLHGHLHVVNLLLEWKADLGARTIDGRNPLDCAIDKEHRCCVQAILQHHNWKNAMRNAYMDKLSGKSYLRVDFEKENAHREGNLL